MKKLIFVLIALLTISVGSASAQTYLTNTTTTAAMTSTQTTVNLTATTSVEVGGYFYIDHELMKVVAINTTTKVAQVTRQTSPAATKPFSHGSGAVVYIATVAQAPLVMLDHPAAIRAGSCTITDQRYLPVFDVIEGDMYTCRYAAANDSYRRWVVTNVQGLNGAGSLPTAWP